MSQRYARIGLNAAALFSIVGLPAAAQRVPANYSVITFRKVAPEKVDAFLAFEKDQTKKFMQARVDSGAIKSWSLLKLTSPYAAGSDYNYAVVVVSDKFPELDPAASEMEPIYAKAGLSRPDYGRKLRELSAVVNQQITRTQLRVGAPIQTGDYIRVDYHLTPSDRPNELYETEEAIFAPMFKTIVEGGKGLKTWTVASPVYPTAAESEHTLITTQTFKDTAGLSAGLGTTMEVFQKVHPGRNYLLTMERVRAIDKIVKVRIYHVLDTLGSPVMSTQSN